MLMKKSLLRIFSFLVALAVFIGCQKKEKASSISSAYKKIDLVSEDMARKIAEKFDPTAFFDMKHADGVPANSPYQFTANGNNRIKNVFTIRDSSGYPALYVCNFES